MKRILQAVVFAATMAPLTAHAQTYCIVDITDPTKCIDPVIECNSEDVFNLATFGASITALCKERNQLKKTVSSLSDANEIGISTQDSLENSVKELEAKVESLKRVKRELTRKLRRATRNQ